MGDFDSQTQVDETIPPEIDFALEGTPIDTALALLLDAIQQDVARVGSALALGYVERGEDEGTLYTKLRRLRDYRGMTELLRLEWRAIQLEEPTVLPSTSRLKVAMDRMYNRGAKEEATGKAIGTGGRGTLATGARGERTPMGELRRPFLKALASHDGIAAVRDIYRTALQRKFMVAKPADMQPIKGKGNVTYLQHTMGLLVKLLVSEGMVTRHSGNQWKLEEPGLRYLKGDPEFDLEALQHGGGGEEARTVNGTAARRVAAAR